MGIVKKVFWKKKRHFWVPKNTSPVLNRQFKNNPNTVNEYLNLNPQSKGRLLNLRIEIHLWSFLTFF